MLVSCYSTVRISGDALNRPLTRLGNVFIAFFAKEMEPEIWPHYENLMIYNLLRRLMIFEVRSETDL